MFRMTVSPEDAPDAPTYLRIEFIAGIPSKVINKTKGVEFTDPLEGFNHLNEVAGKKKDDDDDKILYCLLPVVIICVFLNAD